MRNIYVGNLSSVFCLFCPDIREPAHARMQVDESAKRLASLWPTLAEGNLHHDVAICGRVVFDQRQPLSVFIGPIGSLCVNTFR
jgi:hypothetical protein